MLQIATYAVRAPLKPKIQTEESYQACLWSQLLPFCRPAAATAAGPQQPARDNRLMTTRSLPPRNETAARLTASDQGFKVEAQQALL